MIKWTSGELNTRLRIFLCFFIVASVFANQPYYRELDKRKTADLLKESCENEQNPQIASCIELGLLYKKFKEEKFEKERVPSINPNNVDGNGDPKMITYDQLGNEYIKRSCDIYKNKEACGILKGQERFQSSDLLMWAAVIAMGIAVLIVANLIFEDNEKFAAQEKIEEAESDQKSQGVFDRYGPILKYSRPFFKRYLTPIVEGMKTRKSIQEKYKRKIAGAGLTDVLTPEDFFAFKLFLILGFPVVFFAVREFMEADWDIALIPVMSIVGFMYPDLWINGLIDRRRIDIIKGMPFAVDMLALSVEAGLDYMQAMAKVIEKSRPGPLTDEFTIVIKENRLGAPKSVALRNMAWRTDVMQINSFCATLIAADSVGANIGPILKALSVEIRQKKSAQIEKDGQTAATKILFPMMMFIVPAVFIMIMAPIGIEMIRGGGN